jgi:hypothetical protein
LRQRLRVLVVCLTRVGSPFPLGEPPQIVFELITTAIGRRSRFTGVRRGTLSAAASARIVAVAIRLPARPVRGRAELSRGRRSRQDQVRIAGAAAADLHRLARALYQFPRAALDRGRRGAQRLLRGGSASEPQARAEKTRSPPAPTMARRACLFLRRDIRSSPGGGDSLISRPAPHAVQKRVSALTAAPQFVQNDVMVRTRTLAAFPQEPRTAVNPATRARQAIMLGGIRVRFLVLTVESSN